MVKKMETKAWLELAAAKDDTRPVITHIFKNEHGTIACDGYRLQLSTTPDNGFPEGLSHTSKTIARLDKQLKDKIITEYDHDRLTLNSSIGGRFPDFSKIIPDTGEESGYLSVHVEPEPVIVALKAIKSYFGMAYAVDISFESEEGVSYLKLLAKTEVNNANTAEFKIRCELLTDFSGDQKVNITTNANYVLDALQGMKERESVLICFGDNDGKETRPMFIRGGRREAVVMPMSR